jgi:hypothetical protein
MTDITYTHETPPDEQEADYPESTLSLRLDVDGIGLSWTLRGTDESMSKRLPRVLEYLKRLQERLPRVAAPLDRGPGQAQPPLEEREDWCPIHHKPLVKQSNERGSWWSHQVPGEGWCRGKRRKAGA